MRHLPAQLPGQRDGPPLSRPSESCRSASASCPTTAEARRWMPAGSTAPADAGRPRAARAGRAARCLSSGSRDGLRLEEELRQGGSRRGRRGAGALSAAHGEIRLTARLASTRNELEAVLAAPQGSRGAPGLKAALNAAQDGAPVAPTRANSTRCARAARSRPERADRHRSPSLQPLAAPPAGELTTGTGVPRSCSAWAVSTCRAAFIIRVGRRFARSSSRSTSRAPPASPAHPPMSATRRRIARRWSPTSGRALRVVRPLRPSRRARQQRLLRVRRFSA